MALARQGEAAGAHADFTAALVAEPRLTRARLERAMLAFDDGRFAQAAEDFATAAATDYVRAWEWALWAHISRQRGGAASATASLRPPPADANAAPAWSAEILAVYRGDADADDLAVGLDDADSAEVAAFAFFLGEYFLLADDAATAIELLERAVKTGETGTYAYAAARAELRRLGFLAE